MNRFDMRPERLARLGVALLTGALLSAPLGCTPPSGSGTTAGGSKRVTIDGSSTLVPMISVAKALFDREGRPVTVRLGESGTTNGFKLLLNADPQRRVDICMASRPMAPSEQALAQERGIEFIELPFALDGIVILTHPGAAFCEYLTREELQRMWEPGSRVSNWRDVREGFPDQPLTLMGPNAQHGTFDVFSELVNGKPGQIRRDFIMHAEYNTTITGVAGQRGALAFLTFSYLEGNRDKVRAVAVDFGRGPVQPSPDTVRSGRYPLARPLFLYVLRTAADRPEVIEFIEFALQRGQQIVEHERVRSIALSPDLYEASQRRYAQRVTGTVYLSPDDTHRSLADLYLGREE